METKLTHFDESGNAIMVDVSEKQPTKRVAVASGKIKMNEQAFVALQQGTVKKGDVLGVARVAGIMGLKQTSNFIPLCHPLATEKATVDFEILEDSKQVKVTCTVQTTGKTGVEMEALMGVNITLLTIYDMCKALDKTMEMSEIGLEHKTGGKSGDFSKV